MICQECRDQTHEVCIDVDQEQEVEFRPDGKMTYSLKPGRLYRSCDCLHRVTKRAEPATGSAGE